MNTNGDRAPKPDGKTGGKNTPERSRFCLHEWTIDAEIGEIRNQEKTVRLEPKVMDVLVYLAMRPGKLITRAELEESVWADVVVSYETLTSAIQKLRKAFDDDAHNPRFIETIPKRGYRLVAPVRPSSGAENTNRADAMVRPVTAPVYARHSLLLGAASLVIATIVFASYWGATSPPFPNNETKVESTPPAQQGKPTLAVLPFKNLSEDKEQEYFSDGLTEDLITDLSKISGLFVMSRNSTSGFKGQPRQAQEVGKTLGASHVIEGSVRKAGNTVRITVQLIDAASGQNLWADRYDRKLEDIFAIQDEVIGKITSMLSIQLTLKEKERVAIKGTENLEAYDLYLRGLRQESFFTEASNSESRHLFERAIERDPTFALAYAHLAQAYSLAQENGWIEEKAAAAQKALALAEKAVELDGELPQANWTLGWILARPPIRAPERAMAALRRTVTLAPNYADGHAYLANVLNSIGRAEEALGVIQTAMRINPRYPFWYMHLRGQSLFLQGRYEESIPNFQAAIERNPTVARPHRFLVAAYGHLGRMDDAAWEISELESLGQAPTIKSVREISHFTHPPYLKIYMDGLRKAGVPEE